MTELYRKRMLQNDLSSREANPEYSLDKKRTCKMDCFISRGARWAQRQPCGRESIRGWRGGWMDTNVLDCMNLDCLEYN
jgi:hypothetical protein